MLPVTETTWTHLPFTNMQSFSSYVGLSHNLAQPVAMQSVELPLYEFTHLAALGYTQQCPNADQSLANTSSFDLPVLKSLHTIHSTVVNHSPVIA